jgi:hypothetical protein
MIALLLFGFAAAQVALVLFQPIALVYLSLLTGGVPLTFGQGEINESDFGRMDLSATRMFGLLIASALLACLHFTQAWTYLCRWKYHVLFLLFCCATLAWSPSLVYGTRMIAKLVSPLLFMVLIMLAVSTMRQLRTMENMILIAAVVMLSLAGATKVLGLQRADVVGLTVPGVGPATFSAYILAAGMLALAGLRDSNKVLKMGLVGLFAVVVILGNTRITIGAMFVGFSILLIVGLKGFSRYFLPLAGIVALPALFILNPRFRERMFYGAEGGSVDAVLNDPLAAIQHIHGSGRFDAWDVILNKFFLPNPVVGSGIGATQHYFYSQIGGGIGVIHSEYVRLLSEVGLLGLGLFLVTILVYLTQLINTFQSSSNAETKKYALAGIGGIVAYVIFMATDNAFDYVTQLGIYVFSMVAMGEKSRELELAAQSEVSVAVPVGDNASPIVTESPSVRPSRRRFPLLGEG